MISENLSENNHKKIIENDKTFTVFDQQFGGGRGTTRPHTHTKITMFLLKFIKLRQPLDENFG
jgi:hypothetical protein